MSNCVVSLLPAIFGGLLAVVALTADSQAADPVKDCLTAPGQPTQGGHWRYRIDRATKRQCWYVRSDDRSPAKLASEAAKPSDPPAATPLRPSVADARAEIFPAPENAIPANMANVANADKAAGNPPTSSAPAPSLAERWSDHPGADAPPRTIPSLAPAAVRPTQAVPARQVDDSGNYSIWMLLSALAGALALVGIAGASIVKFGRRIVISDHDDHGRDHGIAAPASREAISPSVQSPGESPISWIRIARETQEAHRRAEEIEQLLARGRAAA
jgi:hypothetical protein